MAAGRSWPLPGVGQRHVLLKHWNRLFDTGEAQGNLKVVWGAGRSLYGFVDAEFGAQLQLMQAQPCFTSVAKQLGLHHSKLTALPLGRCYRD